MKNEVLKFSTNWNEKLFTDHFTTIRLYNPRKYSVGAKFDLYLKTIFMGEVEVIAHRQISVGKINDWIAYLDTGYDAAETQKILLTMYKNIDNFGLNTSLSWVLLKKIDKP